MTNNWTLIVKNYSELFDAMNNKYSDSEQTTSAKFRFTGYANDENWLLIYDLFLAIGDELKNTKLPAKSKDAALKLAQELDAHLKAHVSSPSTQAIKSFSESCCKSINKHRFSIEKEPHWSNNFKRMLNVIIDSIGKYIGLKPFEFRASSDALSDNYKRSLSTLYHNKVISLDPDLDRDECSPNTSPLK